MKKRKYRDPMLVINEILQQEFDSGYEFGVRSRWRRGTIIQNGEKVEVVVDYDKQKVWYSSMDLQDAHTLVMEDSDNR